MKTVNEFMKEYGNYNIKDEEAILKLLERPRPKTVWYLQRGDEYWFVDYNGGIKNSFWTDDAIDRVRRDIGNRYLTEEEVEFAFERKKVIAEMKRLGGTENMMSLGDVYTPKYAIRYSHKAKELSIISYCHHQYISNIYFATKEQAQKAIDTIGEARIKKYIFYVNE